MPGLAVIAVVLAAGCGLAAGCAGSGTAVVDGTTCAVWLDGNGRDAYLQAHGLPSYDAGNRPRTRAVGDAMTAICADRPALVVDEALRMAAARDR